MTADTAHSSPSTHGVRAAMSRITLRRRRLRDSLAEAWYYAGPLADHWYLAPEAQTPTWQKALIGALRPVRAVTVRLRIAWLLLTTPPNTKTRADWERRDLRFKAVALLLLPWSHGGYEELRYHDPVLCFDHHSDGYGWSATFLDAPAGWKVRRLHLYTDGDTTW